MLLLHVGNSKFKVRRNKGGLPHNCAAAIKTISGRNPWANKQHLGANALHSGLICAMNCSDLGFFFTPVSSNQETCQDCIIIAIFQNWLGWLWTGRRKRDWQALWQGQCYSKNSFIRSMLPNLLLRWWALVDSALELGLYVGKTQGSICTCLCREPGNFQHLDDSK